MQLICQYCGKPFESRRSFRKFCSRKCANRDTTSRTDERLQTNKLYVAWACGGGIDSTAIAALIIQGKIPKPDYAYMVDAGYELESTWDHVAVLQERLNQVGVDLRIIFTKDYTDNDLINPQGYVVIPVHRYSPDKKQGKNPIHCSGKWKTQVSRKWLREQGIKRCVNWVGIALEESHRAKVSRFKWIVNEYPLIALRLTREDCIHLIASMGWDMPPRTSCYMCPNHTNREWKVMAADEPKEFDKAVEIERQLQAHDPSVYLHNSCVPIDQWVQGHKDKQYKCVSCMVQ